MTNITVSSPASSYVLYTRLPSPVYHFVINLVVSFPIRWRLGVLMKPMYPMLEDHLLSDVRGCLFNTFAAALHIGGRPPSATWGRAMPWWQRPTYHGTNLHRGDKIFPSNTVARSGHCETEILSVIPTKLVFSNFVFCLFVIKVSRHRSITNKFNEVYNYLL